MRGFWGSFLVVLTITVFGCGGTLYAQNAQDVLGKSKAEEHIAEMQQYFNNLQPKDTLNFMSVEELTIDPQKFYKFESACVEDVEVDDGGNFVAISGKYFPTNLNIPEKEEVAKIINEGDGVIFVKLTISHSGTLEDKSSVCLVVDTRFIEVDKSLTITRFVPFVSKVFYCTEREGRKVQINKDIPNVGWYTGKKKGAYNIYALTDVSNDNGETFVKKGETIGKIVIF